MFSKQQFLDALTLELRVIRHLASRLPRGTLEYRPTPGQRSTIELLRYLSTAGIDLAHMVLSGDWQPEVFTHRTPMSLRPEEFDLAMERQEAELRAVIDPLTERELLERRATLPTGETTNLGAALVTVVLRALCGYRMQLFLYAKASGATKLTTANCWFGVDAPG